MLNSESYYLASLAHCLNPKAPEKAFQRAHDLLKDAELFLKEQQPVGFLDAIEKALPDKTPNWALTPPPVSSEPPPDKQPLPLPLTTHVPRPPDITRKPTKYLHPDRVLDARENLKRILHQHKKTKWGSEILKWDDETLRQRLTLLLLVQTGKQVERKLGARAKLTLGDQADAKRRLPHARVGEQQARAVKMVWERLLGEVCKCERLLPIGNPAERRGTIKLLREIQRQGAAAGFWKRNCKGIDRTLLEEACSRCWGLPRQEK